MIDDAAPGRQLIRNVFGAYAATPGYNRAFEWMGFARRGASRSASASPRATAPASPRAVTDGLCDAMAVIGNAETVRARVRAYAEQGVDVCVINPIGDPTPCASVARDGVGRARRPRLPPERRAARHQGLT